MLACVKPALLGTRKQGAVVVRASRTGNGPTNHAPEDDADTFVTSDTLTPQKARILMMLGQLKTKDPMDFHRMFDTY